METMPDLINETVFNQENYMDWSNRVKTYLMTQDLWDSVESSSEPPTPKTKSASESGSEKNAKALHAIQMFCGPDTFSDIREISSAKIAWDTLAEKYRLNMETKPALINEAVFNQDNYLDWSIRVKTYLMTQDLWDAVESSSEPPTRKTKSPAKALNTKNKKALDAIRMFCGRDTLSDIKEVDTGKTAWDTLKGKYRHRLAPSDTKPAVFNEVNEDNYSDWSIRVKTYLMAQNLWDFVESSGEPPNTESALKDWREKNAKALRAIQIFCGPDTLSDIREKNAKIAWDTLAEKYSTEELPYSDLRKALQSGEWINRANEFLNRPQFDISAKITVTGGTVLHVAVVAGQENTVKELVKLMPEKDWEIKDIYGFTALALTSYNGNYRIAECLLEKNKRLINIETEDGNIPVILALNCGHLDLARYFYLESEVEILKPKNATMGASVVSQAIQSKALDIALRAIQRRQKLVLTKDRYGKSPLYALACMPDAFPSENRLVFWKRWICSHVDIQATGPTNEIRLNCQTSAENRSNHENITGSGLSSLRQLVSNIRTLLGIKHLCEMKLAHCQSKELLRIMVEKISNSNIKQRSNGLLIEAILGATKEGNFEFVFEMVKANPELVWSHDETSTSIFSVAVQYRQAKIFSLIYGHDMKTAFATHGDSVYDNNLLHMAGMSGAASTSLNDIAGAALQMQRELQWFKEVESIVPPSVQGKLNGKNLTPRQLFTKNHEDMMGKGEKWMKDTASSCTVVGALIVTIMFAAAFTVPGGNDQNKGFPIFLNEKLFMLFIVSDALSLFSSSTSVLMFLGILTSRYAEDDFLKSLPRKMIIGLSTLFFSIAAMMTAFSAALLLMLRGQSWIVLPVICLASVPVALFVLMQFPLLVTMMVSTYRPGIFNRKMKSWF